MPYPRIPSSIPPTMYSPIIRAQPKNLHDKYLGAFPEVLNAISQVI